ncbi:hypothetical protein MKK69_01680 [Methylobacterium sp. J-026]|uniref:hypothetical protein n=1 Tax=Methylobacterium sp. J-026 TaxID=2836624 RepID=UPI001FBB3A68|nr:hypothetical protein [Methylobacterium sp. J-026]MCJ2132786.1 hypothetical protein [Methylobacterium sp. J-026]
MDVATVKRLSTPNPRDVTCRIRLGDQPAEPVRRPPSSRTIARRQVEAEAAARAASAAQALAKQVQPGLQPPAGRLFATDTAALLLRGPLGGISSTERMVRTLTPLAAGGRHAAAVLVAAGGWQDEVALREALAALGPKLAVLGLRICRRKAGLRMAKVPAAGGHVQ